jgi:hypothetical protein
VSAVAENWGEPGTDEYASAKDERTDHISFSCPRIDRRQHSGGDAPRPNLT